MSKKKNFLDLIKTHRATKKDERFEGNFLNYLELLSKEPEVVKSAHKRLYDALTDYGVEAMSSEDPRKRKIFDEDNIKIYDYFSAESLSNPSVIQFYHRITSYLILLFLFFLNYSFIKKKLTIKYILIFDIAIFLQILLGVLTLVNGVEIKLASLHQIGSIFVLSSYLLILYKNTN